jgi:hypothetical protein
MDLTKGIPRLTGHLLRIFILVVAIFALMVRCFITCTHFGVFTNAPTTLPTTLPTDDLMVSMLRPRWGTMPRGKK